MALIYISSLLLLLLLTPLRPSLSFPSSSSHDTRAKPVYGIMRLAGGVNKFFIGHFVVTLIIPYRLELLYIATVVGLSVKKDTLFLGAQKCSQ